MPKGEVATWRSAPIVAPRPMYAHVIAAELRTRPITGEICAACDQRITDAVTLAVEISLQQQDGSSVHSVNAGTVHICGGCLLGNVLHSLCVQLEARGEPLPMVVVTRPPIVPPGGSGNVS